MYLERGGGLRSAVHGDAFIGRVSITRTGATLRWRDRSFQSLKGGGYKANCFEVETGERWWISGCRQDGRHALYPRVVTIDDDVAEAYWREIRGQPERATERSFRSEGKHARSGRRGQGKVGAERPGHR